MVAEEDVQAAEGLISFIEQCPSMFHTAATISSRLEVQGFARLSEGDAWRGRIEPGGRYYAERNGSSIIAFKVGEAAAADPDRFHFQLTAAHGDSPTFKVKAAPELEGPEGSLRLNVEAYGGMIDYTWFDRPLSVAGRVLVRTATAEGERVESRLIAPDRDIALIPSLAIHLDRGMNDGLRARCR